jgi:phage FluMu protein Com
METVQLQCGQCKKLIAIRVEHMGSQVQCPHCRSVVQTPPRAATPAPPPDAPTPPAPNMELQQPESIFAGAEASDSLMGEQPAPKVEMPAAAASLDSSPSAADTSAAPPSVETDFSQFKKKPSFDKSVIPLLLLIFLVPYALMTTAFIAYLLLTQGKSGHPLDYLRDPAPAKDKGGPRPARMQPAHDQPLADHQRSTLGMPIRAGDLLVTPQRVLLTGGDLKLFLRVKNVSTNTKFEPMQDLFVRYAPGNPSKPYTFLESKLKKVDEVENIYGAFLAYHKSPQAKDEEISFALLGPQQEITVVLTTTPNYRDKKLIKNIKNSADDSYTWRVQVRRGFVKVDGKDVSATTVIGIDFTNAEIEREVKS